MNFLINQSIENLLNLAFDATAEERQKSLNLDVGFEPETEEWEIVVKYTGNLDEVRPYVSRVTKLRNGYGILAATKENIEKIAKFPQIEYIEKPKRLFFAAANGRRASCINELQNARYLSTEALFGRGVLVAILDSGIDFDNLDFKNEDGSTRILRIWDQTIEGNPPLGYELGTEYTSEEINSGVAESRDFSGHGTAVAGVAAGNGRNSDGIYRGAASQSSLLIVKLGTPRANGFPRTTELMMALNYAVDVAEELNMPVAINISIGNTYGAHDGSSLLERFIEDISNQWKNVICIGMGNEGNSAGHISGTVEQNEETIVELAVQENSTSLTLQIWKAYFDVMDVSLITPSGNKIGPITEILGTQRFFSGNTQILLYYGEPSPFSIDQEIYIEFLPGDIFVDSGRWKIVLTPRDIVTGEYSMWLPSEAVLNEGTGFLFPSAERTLTIPSTAFGAIGVGAYDARTLSYADFSGRGPAGPGRRVKPDLAAPGVGIVATVPGGTYGEFSGTSFAAPFVTGAAALLMEWGIVRGNDPYLYGEKVKAYLQRGARELPVFFQYPNSEIGYGALCLNDSFPR